MRKTVITLAAAATLVGVPGSAGAVSTIGAPYQCNVRSFNVCLYDHEGGVGGWLMLYVNPGQAIDLWYKPPGQSNFAPKPWTRHWGDRVVSAYNNTSSFLCFFNWDSQNRKHVPLGRPWAPGEKATFSWNNQRRADRLLITSQERQCAGL